MIKKVMELSMKEDEKAKQEMQLDEAEVIKAQ